MMSKKPPPEPVMVPEWVVLLVGRQTLEIEALQRSLEQKAKDALRAATTEPEDG